MAWPTPQDYNEAIQNPRLNFLDAELKEGVLEVTPMGLPRVASGAFASVYRMKSRKRDVAVRCFLHDIADQQKRYEAISKFVCNDNLECTVDFDYIAKGIRIQAGWFPVLKMEWAWGKSLDEFVRANLHDGKSIQQLTQNFRHMVKAMRLEGIAHGDLQHGNVIVLEDCNMKLVDYDGMYVPALAGAKSNELGHRNYQHPDRTEVHFGPYLDNFAAWSIYTSLFCLTRDPGLLERLKGGDECLLFRQFDYRNPTKSRAFATLEEHDDEQISSLAKIFRSMISMPLDKLPYLDDEVHEAEKLPPMQFRINRTEGSNLPNWMVDDFDEGSREVDIRDSIGFGSAEVHPGSASEAWPTLAQYVAAIATPAACFFDEDLKLSRAPTNASGRLEQLVKTGENAVFKLQRYVSNYAVKVFLHADPHRSERYSSFASFMKSDVAKYANLHWYIPRFDYQQRGIRIGNRTYPILKMEWIEGRPLNTLTDSPVSPEMMAAAKHQFRLLAQALRAADIAHGELEPNNLIISPDGLKLIDFDAVFLRTVSTPRAVSRGRSRHPAEPPHVDINSDVFPEWLIDTALVVLGEHPEFRMAVERNRFLLEWEDFYQPQDCDVLSAMERNPDTTVHNRALLMRCLANVDRANLPLLTVDARIPLEFATEHGLDFVQTSPGYVCPDAAPGERYGIAVAAPPRTSIQSLRTRGSALSAYKVLSTVGWIGVAWFFLTASWGFMALMFGIVLALSYMELGDP